MCHRKSITIIDKRFTQIKINWHRYFLLFLNWFQLIYGTAWDAVFCIRVRKDLTFSKDQDPDPNIWFGSGSGAARMGMKIVWGKTWFFCFTWVQTYHFYGHKNLYFKRNSKVQLGYRYWYKFIRIRNRIRINLKTRIRIQTKSVWIHKTVEINENY